ncbi:bile acid:sodium symporter family protein [Palleronia sp. KMU-117]|uniref:bile acid:sodium symporter family protein n=1 Tax=Palleronia sp. KMU-117 TaxID=3434108 RepID=UPI003D73A8B0
MNLFVDLLLPLGLALVMFVLGLGLVPDDFRRILQRPRAFFTGAASQLLLIPCVTVALIAPVPLEPALATGMMILAVCPGGPVSNMLTRLTGGDVALSVTLTGTMVLLSIFTLPPLTALVAGHFLQTAPPDFSVTRLVMTMLLAAALPVLLGFGVRLSAPAFVARTEPAAFRLAAVIFTLIVVGAVAANWALLAERFAVLAPLCLALMLSLLVLGYALARLLRLTEREARAIAIETAVQNGTLGVTVGGLVGGGVVVGNEFLMPSAVYGVLSYIVVIPAVLLYARLRPISPR